MKRRRGRQSARTLSKTALLNINSRRLSVWCSSAHSGVSACSAVRRKSAGIIRVRSKNICTRRHGGAAIPLSGTIPGVTTETLAILARIARRNQLCGFGDPSASPRLRVRILLTACDVCRLTPGLHCPTWGGRSALKADQFSAVECPISSGARFSRGRRQPPGRRGWRCRPDWRCRLPRSCAGYGA